MKTLSIIISLLCVIVLYIIYVQVNSDKVTKICYINVTKVLSEYEGMKEARLNFENSKQKWSDTLNVLYSNIQLSSAKSKSDNKQEEFEQIRIYNRYKEIVTQRSIDQENILTRQILNQVRSFSKDFAKRYGYDFVIASDDFGMVFYHNDQIDRTDLFLSELNAIYYGKK